jgi:hypothetical protein
MRIELACAYPITLSAIDPTQGRAASLSHDRCFTVIMGRHLGKLDNHVRLQSAAGRRSL